MNTYVCRQGGQQAVNRYLTASWFDLVLYICVYSSQSSLFARIIAQLKQSGGLAGLLYIVKMFKYVIGN